jgi:hypothetical protein
MGAPRLLPSTPFVIAQFLVPCTVPGHCTPAHTLTDQALGMTLHRNAFPGRLEAQADIAAIMPNSVLVPTLLRRDEMSSNDKVQASNQWLTTSSQPPSSRWPPRKHSWARQSWAHQEVPEIRRGLHTHRMRLKPQTRGPVVFARSKLKKKTDMLLIT